MYWEEANKSVHSPSTPYSGIWTPANLRAELENALRLKFPGQVDSSGSTAFRVHSSSARVDADVVPCFDYRYYLKTGYYREGAKVFKKDNSGLVNYSAQQLANGREKNTRTGSRYKKTVRILKRTENAMLENGVHREVPSYFVECLAYNCPDNLLNGSSWTEVVRRVLFHIWDGLDGPEPGDEAARWVEPNECKFLFHPSQAWSRTDGREFAYAAWNYLGLKS
jgi:hypothetical protein